jgi:hypothetical protein
MRGHLPLEREQERGAWLRVSGASFRGVLVR